MLATMSSELQAGLIVTNAYDMFPRDMFQTQAHTERYEVSRALNACKMAKRSPVSAHVMKMKGCIDNLERLGNPVPLQYTTNLILSSLSNDYKQFAVNFNMNNIEKSIAELHSMLKTAEASIRTKSKDVLVVKNGGNDNKRNGRGGKGKDCSESNQKARKAKGNGKNKKHQPNIVKTENRRFKCNEVGHWKKDCTKHQEGDKSNTSDGQGK